MIALGVANKDMVSLFLVATIIKKKDYLAIDAGSKALSSDSGVHGNKNIKGFGLIAEDESLTIERLSEKYGIVTGKTIHNFKIGEQIKIIPNHACVMVNLFDKIEVFTGGIHTDTYKIKGRGR